MPGLASIEHIVILMMENRSFDHMLGYLSLKNRVAVDGLDGTETNPDADGALVKVRLLQAARFPEDPKHDWTNVAEQIAGGNRGFVRNYQKAYPDADHGQIMGYYDDSLLKVYDHLARSFCVCDRWFSSIPGPTIPNRLYSISGTSGGRKNNPGIGGLVRRIKLKTIFDCLDKALPDRPLGDRWGYYFHDLAMLWLYRQHGIDAGRRIAKLDTFFARAQRGNLPAVSWIDPNFGDVGSSNDDHPPKADLRDGQALVARVYNALFNGGSNLWKKTLLVMLYDEHGGFFDHVVPGAAADDHPDFREYGVRVPALAISPWIRASVDSIVRDHTSILKTILLRFAPSERLTTRVAEAKDLGSLLSLAAPRTDATAAPVPAAPMRLAFALAGAPRRRLPPPSDAVRILRAYRPKGRRPRAKRRTRR